ncbi:unnamed protein product, partial [marine sediment metagenome]
MSVNSDSIYGTKASPITYDYEWGTVTCKPGKVFLHVFNWKANYKDMIVLYGLINKVKKASLLADSSRNVKVIQEYNEELAYNNLKVMLPGNAPDAYDSVISLEIEGELKIDDILLQQPDGRIILNSFQAIVHKGREESQMHLSSGGVIEKWFNKDDWLSWDFKVIEPGEYELNLLTKTDFWGEWDFDHEVTIGVAEQEIGCTVKDDEKYHDKPLHYQDRCMKCGRVSFKNAGNYTLTIKPIVLHSENNRGLSLRSINLVPVK